MPIQIRLASQPHDIAEFRRLLLEYEASLPEHLRHSDLDVELGDLRAAYTGPRNAAWIALVDDVACGCVALRELDPSAAIVRKMYVQPDRRGKGVARALFAALKATAETRNYSRLVLDTDREALPAAYVLYQSLGFIECEAYADVDYPSPTYMELRLGRSSVP